MIDRNTIHRFFLQQCNKEEIAAIEQYIKEYPEKFDEYLNESDWDAFCEPDNFPEKKSELLWKKIYFRTHKFQIFFHYLKRVAIAASVVFIAGLAWLLLQGNKDQPVNTARNEERKQEPKIITNTSAEKMTFRLSDGSVITLMPKSSLICPDTFINNRRDVTLSGEAYFKVAKDKSRPFTVYSDAIATTVLGTQFSVKSFAGEKSIRVSLNEGKVMVHSADSVIKTLSKNIYLKPGDVLVYNKVAMTAAVTHTQKDIITAKKATTNRLELSPEYISGNNWYMFNNQPPAEVLDQLQQLYNQSITYSKADVRGKSFIGKLDHTDSLENILQSIALLNNLKVIKQEDGSYFLKK